MHSTDWNCSRETEESLKLNPRHHAYFFNNDHRSHPKKAKIIEGVDNEQDWGDMIDVLDSIGLLSTLDWLLGAVRGGNGNIRLE